MDETEALNIILPNVSSHAAGPEHGLKRVRNQGLPEEISALNYLLSKVPQAEVTYWEGQPSVNRFVAGGESLETAARFAGTIERCGKEIYQRRLETIANPDPANTLRPYDDHPFNTLSVDNDALVGLNQMKDFGTVLIHNDWLAHLASTTGATNDTHWLLPAIINLGVRNETRVRIDPFVYGPKDSFPMIMQKMTVYGKPLDWDSLAKLREPLIGQFDNFDGFGPKVRTDYAWIPRDNELHFEAEEMPHNPEGRLSSGRYFHAIYNLSTEKVTHFDGAMRVYTEEKLRARQSVHLAKAGKAGRRAKIFRVDAPIERNKFAEVAKAFFLWNQDLQHYFDGEERTGYL